MGIVAGYGCAQQALDCHKAKIAKGRRSVDGVSREKTISAGSGPIRNGGGVDFGNFTWFHTMSIRWGS